MAIRPALGAVRRCLRRRPRGPLGVTDEGMRLVAEVPFGYESLLGEGGYEPAVLDAMRRLVGRGSVCVDVGANVGILTLWLAAFVGESGFVTAFEPLPENVDLLHRNLRHNSRLSERVAVERVAVTDGARPSVELFPARGGGHGEWTISSEFAAREDVRPVARRPLRVPATSLDAYFPAGSRLDFVKLDIEGAEVPAIAGMARLLRETRPVILLEFHREVGWPAIPALMDAGYILETLEGAALPTPAGPDDVPYQLVARSPDVRDRGSA
jgi:FkbM family methyltransferase